MSVAPKRYPARAATGVHPEYRSCHAILHTGVAHWLGLYGLFALSRSGSSANLVVSPCSSAPASPGGHTDLPWFACRAPGRVA